MAAVVGSRRLAPLSIEAMNLPRQLTLDLVRPIEPSLDNFVVGRNAEMIAVLRSLEGGGAERFLYLWGEPGSGRSHLLAALARQPDALLASAADALPAAESARLILVDDVERADVDRQQQIFVLLNEVRARPSAAFVATGSAPPAQLPLRDDVRTRLAWGLVYQVHALNDEEKAGALEAHARSRGLALPADVVAYLLTHMPRDMRTLVAILDALDAHALAAKRALTVPFVREWAQRAA